MAGLRGGWVRRWRTVAVVAVATLPLVGCGAGNGTQVHAASGTGVSGAGLVRFVMAKRKPAPSLTGRTLTGQQVSLAGMGAGRVVFVNVWASWCTPCRQESPLLAASAKALVGRGVVFLGLDEDYSASAGRSFVAKTGSTYPQLADKDGSLLRRLKVLPQSGIPSTAVIDKRGRIAALVIGAVTASEVNGLVDELSAET